MQHNMQTSCNFPCILLFFYVIGIFANRPITMQFCSIARNTECSTKKNVLKTAKLSLCCWSLIYNCSNFSRILLNFSPKFIDQDYCHSYNCIGVMLYFLIPKSNEMSFLDGKIVYKLKWESDDATWSSTNWINHTRFIRIIKHSTCQHY